MFRHRRGRRCPRGFIADNNCMALCQVAPGQQVRIRDLEGLHHPFRSHLHAYGLIPGRCIRVITQTPVTIVQVEQMELAIEESVAEAILVEPVRED